MKTYRTPKITILELLNEKMIAASGLHIDVDNGFTNNEQDALSTKYGCEDVPWSQEEE